MYAYSYSPYTYTKRQVMLKVKPDQRGNLSTLTAASTQPTSPSPCAGSSPAENGRIRILHALAVPAQELSAARVQRTRCVNDTGAVWWYTRGPSMGRCEHRGRHLVSDRPRRVGVRGALIACSVLVCCVLAARRPRRRTTPPPINATGSRAQPRCRLEAGRAGRRGVQCSAQLFRRKSDARIAPASPPVSSARWLFFRLWTKELGAVGC